MRVSAAATLALAIAAATVAPSVSAADTTYISLGATYTAATDADGDPVAPATAILTDVSTSTRTRGSSIIEVVYDSDDNPLLTSTLTAALPQTTATTTATTRTAPIGGAPGGGAGQVTSQASLQKISGYTPPHFTPLPSPTAYSSGSIIRPGQIPGYSNFSSSINKIPVDGRPIYGGGGNKVDSSSGASPAAALRSCIWTTTVLAAAVGLLAWA